MAETFVKLFGSITESTIWCEDSDTRIVWITMLAMADAKGYVGASLPGLAARAQVPIAKVQAAIEKFLNPDPYSRSKDFEGRRIEPAERGWRLLNYLKFREQRDEETRREYERERKREQRAATDDGNEYVYFALDKATGYVKVGYSSNPEVRIANGLKDAGAVGPLELLAKVLGGKEKEKELHHRFGPLWVRGEWFRNEGELAAFVSAVSGTQNRCLPVSAQEEGEEEAEEEGESDQEHIGGEYPAAFEEVWEGTNRVGGKWAALKAWKKRGSPTWETLRPKYQAYMRSADPSRGFVVHLSKWLNQRMDKQDWQPAQQQGWAHMGGR